MKLNYVQGDAWNKLKHLASKMDQQMEQALQIQEETMRFTRTALKELAGSKCDPHQLMSPRTPGQEGVRGSEEIVMYKGVNIAALGGDSPAKIAKNIAEALFTPTELGSLVIDPNEPSVSPEIGTPTSTRD